MEKLPDDLKLLISRKFGGNVWTPDNFLRYILNELLAKELCFLNKLLPEKVGPNRKQNSTANIYSGNKATFNKRHCIFRSEENYSPFQSKKVANVESRKEI